MPQADMRQVSKILPQAAHNGPHPPRRRVILATTDRMTMELERIFNNAVN